MDRKAPSDSDNPPQVRARLLFHISAIGDGATTRETESQAKPGESGYVFNKCFAPIERDDKQPHLAVDCCMHVD